MPRERGRILRRHHPRKRMVQYSATSGMGSRVAAYWIPAFAGMTACCGASQCFAEPVIGLSGGETRRRVQRFGGAVFPCAKAGAFAVQRQRQSGEQTGDVRCISLWTSIKFEAENLRQTKSVAIHDLHPHPRHPPRDVRHWRRADRAARGRFVERELFRRPGRDYRVRAARRALGRHRAFCRATRRDFDPRTGRYRRRRRRRPGDCIRYRGSEGTGSRPRWRIWCRCARGASSCMDSITA